jgi:uncharacterized Zn finger protein (UPF0148 family)
MDQCPECGWDLEQGEEMCPNCGAYLADYEESGELEE